MSQWLAFFAWNAGMALAGIARVSQIQLLQTFVTVALAAWVNREAIDTETIVFAVAVVATVVIGQRMRIAPLNVLIYEEMRLAAARARRDRHRGRRR